MEQSKTKCLPANIEQCHSITTDTCLCQLLRCQLQLAIAFFNCHCQLPVSCYWKLSLSLAAVNCCCQLPLSPAFVNCHCQLPLSCHWQLLLSTTALLYDCHVGGSSRKEGEWVVGSFKFYLWRNCWQALFYSFARPDPDSAHNRTTDT